MSEFPTTPRSGRPARPSFRRELANLALLTIAALAGVAFGAGFATLGKTPAFFHRATPLFEIIATISVAAAALVLLSHLSSRSWRLKRAAAWSRRLWREKLTPWLTVLWLPAIALVVFASGATLMLALATPAIVIGIAWMVLAARRAAATISLLLLALWALTGLAMGYFVAP